MNPTSLHKLLIDINGLGLLFSGMAFDTADVLSNTPLSYYQDIPGIFEVPVKSHTNQTVVVSGITPSSTTPSKVRSGSLSFNVGVGHNGAVGISGYAFCGSGTSGNDVQQVSMTFASARCQSGYVQCGGTQPDMTFRLCVKEK